MEVLLVDDHPDVRTTLAEFLEQLGHRAVHAGSGNEALAQIRQSRPDLVLSDLRMPGMSGLELLRAIEGLDDPPPLALMTAFGDADTAIEALRQGAVDYLRKPIDVRELHRLVERHATPAPLASSIREEADGLIVVGVAFARVIELADRLHRAPDLPCLIEGETGTGKELVARRIHHGGRTSVAPFVALNCAAIAPGLFEAELFGYVPGAFTGAAPGGSLGKLAAAADGTLFLDEIGDLPADQQAKLLRLLEDRAWYPVGGSTMHRLRARVVCATNVGLLDRVHAGRFREDLYYRLKVGHLRIPPLRERGDGILPLARLLLDRVAKRRGRGAMRFASTAEAVLADYPWPGNVRELVHVLEQLCLLDDAAVIAPERLREFLETESEPHQATPSSITAPSLRLPKIPPAALDLDPAGCDLDAWQRALVVAALESNGGSPVRTSAYLGISRKVLYTLRKRHGLLPPDAVEDV